MQQHHKTRTCKISEKEGSSSAQEAAKCSRFACSRGRRIKSCRFIAIKDTMAGLFSIHVLHFLDMFLRTQNEVDGGDDTGESEL